MTTAIREAFESNFPLNITPQLAIAITRFVMEYELHDTNMQAFSSPFLGIYKCFFKDSDRSGFFDLFSLSDKQIFDSIETKNGQISVFGVDVADIVQEQKKAANGYFNEVAKTGISSATLRSVIKTIPSINTEFKVVSDPFNLFATYVVYCLGKAKLTDVVKYNAQFAVLKLLQYKFFTSIVAHRFKYAPNEAIMHATFEQMTERFDVKKAGSWKAVIENRCMEMLESTSIHKKALSTFEDDKAVLYFISDFETRIRNQLNVFVSEFMRVKAAGDIVGSYSNTTADTEGNKVIVESEDKMESAILNLYNTSLVTARFIDNNALRIIAANFTAINNQQLRRVIIAFSEYAVKKYKEGNAEEIKENDNVTLYLGPAVFIRYTIQQSWRYCLVNNVNVNNPLQVFKTVKGVFSSSRISDKTIINVRASSDFIINEIQESRRETTVSALRIALILYLVLLAFKLMK